MIVLVLLGCVLVSTAVYAEEQNVALNASVKANSVYAGYLAANAVDGNRNVHWSSTGQGTKESPLWLAVDLGGAFNLSHVDLYSQEIERNIEFYGKGIDYNLYYSTSSDAWDNDSSWIPKVSGSIYTAEYPDNFNAVDFGGVSARYLKFEVDGGYHWAHLHELEAYGAPKVIATPEPASMLLFGLGGGILALRRFRKKGVQSGTRKS